MGRSYGSRRSLLARYAGGALDWFGCCVYRGPDGSRRSLRLATREERWIGLVAELTAGLMDLAARLWLATRDLFQGAGCCGGDGGAVDGRFEVTAQSESSIL